MESTVIGLYRSVFACELYGLGVHLYCFCCRRRDSL